MKSRRNHTQKSCLHLGRRRKRTPGVWVWLREAGKRGVEGFTVNICTLQLNSCSLFTRTELLLFVQHIEKDKCHVSWGNGAKQQRLNCISSSQ
ncbi:hypothetical protein INR49_026269 [Caranx melampygus]|nr:hypothetical protein INR49_026269 [Caranx melampygus]